MSLAADYPQGWWYLSFAVDAHTPEESFRGGCFVQAHTAAHALARAMHLRITPTGDWEVACFGPFHSYAPPENCRNRLLSLKDLEAYLDGGAPESEWGRYIKPTRL